MLSCPVRFQHIIRLTMQAEKSDYNTQFFIGFLIFTTCLHLLQDAGYGEKSLFAPEQDEDDEAKIEDEVCMSLYQLSIMSHIICSK